MTRPSLLREIGGTVFGWLKGQLLNSAYLTLLYTIGYGLLGLPFWWLLGPVCGFLNFVPYAGALVALALTLLAALFAEFDSYRFLGVIGVFVVAQGVEGFYLTPKILGRHLQMPAWAIFLAILAGGFLFGGIGVIFAAPVAAIALIVLRRTR